MHPNRYEEPGNCMDARLRQHLSMTSAIGPGITNCRQKADDAAFIAALAALPKDIFDMSHVPTGCDHEPHGTGSHDLPDVVTPEIFMDRFTHQAAFEALVKFEAALIKVKPTASIDGSFLAASAEVVMSGRVQDIVKQKYIDAGWKNISFTLVNPTTTTVKLYFP